MSDIHGAFQELKEVLNKESYDKLIILGDLFSYGYHYNQEDENEIINILLENKSKLILVKGNCDVFANLDVLGLCTFDTITIPLNGKLVTLTHGNHYKRGFLPDNHGDIIMYGHTHTPCLTKDYDIIYANPGSLGMPRNGSLKGYLIFEDNKLILKTLHGKIIKEVIV